MRKIVVDMILVDAMTKSIVMKIPDTDRDHVINETMIVTMNARTVIRIVMIIAMMKGAVLLIIIRTGEVLILMIEEIIIITIMTAEEISITIIEVEETQETFVVTVDPKIGLHQIVAPSFLTTR